VSSTAAQPPSDGLDGFDPARVHWNLPVARLYEEALGRREASLVEGGPLLALTTPHTGRSPQDKFIVDEPSISDRIAWGPVNRPIADAAFAAVERDMLAYLRARDVFVQDCRAGADPRHRLRVRVVTERAWHSLFARTVLIPAADAGDEATGCETFTVIDAPGFLCRPSRHGTRSETCILVHFGRRLVLIGGTAYAGEIKKSVFTVLNALLPVAGALPMHCSATVGAAGDTALFFGLSGTGKTTLSSDPHRRLVGDDEHGWSDEGIFNFEGGCYAKLIRLSAEAEPQIRAAAGRFGTVLENVVIDPISRRPDFDDEAITENTRGAYPVSYIKGHVPSGRAGHPTHVVMLAADAFGVLPPIARLSQAQALYHFLSGYTARVAGTERGVTEPSATFSTCFGAPFLPLRPAVYAHLLAHRLARHGSQAWLVNTGWTGGPCGTGRRMSIGHTRALLGAALTGALDDVPTRVDPVFGFVVPARCPGVPDAVLDPRSTWADATAYDEQARRLAGMFRDNFRSFQADVSAEVTAAGPLAWRGAAEKGSM
jgi:phosphoenolpyruvate carboxykinase (ATP)